MNIKIKLTYLLLLLSLNFSCYEKNIRNKKSNGQEITETTKNDTLKFSTGIRAILQDSKGNYWFGSHSEGISFYDGKSFKYFTTHEGLSDNQIRSIQEDKNGKIWFGTAKGVCVYHNGTFTQYKTKLSEPKYEWNKTKGDLWFYASEEDGINRFDGVNMNYLVFPKPKNPSTDNSYGVTGITKDRNGIVWIATYAALFNYNGKQVNLFDNEKLNLKKNEILHIRSVLADTKGRIWIGNNGIGVILIEGNSIIHFSENHQLIHPNSKRVGDQSKPGTLEHVFAIEEDSAGNIWFGDRDTGLWRYDNKTLTNYSIGDKSNNTMIWTIYKDNKNNLLFGMSDGNIFRFNGKTFENLF